MALNKERVAHERGATTEKERKKKEKMLSCSTQRRACRKIWARVHKTFPLYPSVVHSWLLPCQLTHYRTNRYKHRIYSILHTLDCNRKCDGLDCNALPEFHTPKNVNYKTLGCSLMKIISDSELQNTHHGGP